MVIGIENSKNLMGQFIWWFHLKRPENRSRTKLFEFIWRLNAMRIITVLKHLKSPTGSTGFLSREFFEVNIS